MFVTFDSRFVTGCIDFVIDKNMRDVVGPDISKHLVDFSDLLIALRAGGIDNMQQQIGLYRLFKRGPESRNQGRRQIADEAHRIGHHHLPGTLYPHATRRGVQGGEQLIGRIGVCPCQGIEQCRFAGVGIAHQRDRQRAAARTRAPLRGALTLHPCQALSQQPDLVAYHATVHFKLRLAWPAHADAPTLPFQVGPHPGQACGKVLQLSQFDLQLALVAFRAQRENIQYEGYAVDHTPLEASFKVALLRRRKRLIEQHDFRAGFVSDQYGLFQFARTNEMGSVRASPARDDGRDNLSPRAFCQHDEFVGVRLVVGLAQVDADNERLHERTPNEIPAGARRAAGVSVLGWYGWIDCLFRRLIHLEINRPGRYNGGNGVLVNHLSYGVAQQYDVLVKGFNLPLQLDAVNQINGYGDVVLTKGV